VPGRAGAVVSGDDFGVALDQRASSLVQLDPASAGLQPGPLAARTAMLDDPVVDGIGVLSTGRGDSRLFMRFALAAATAAVFAAAVHVYSRFGFFAPGGLAHLGLAS